MALIFIFFVIGILILVVWLLIKFVKHGLLAILFLFLIAVVLFSFFTLNAAFNGKEVSLNSLLDIGKAFKVYFSWLGNIFENVKSVTGNVVNVVQNSSNTS